MGADGRVSLREHLEALRNADDRRYAEVGRERDQRYAEVANKLREQINSERGLYASKSDLANAMREIGAQIKPLADYISAAAGAAGGEEHFRTERRLNIDQLVAVIAMIVAIATMILYALKR